MNWGYWGTAGIVAAAPYQERMQQAGIGSITPEEGMAALDALLNGPLDQVGLLKVTPLAVEVY
jgi:polyketide synthase PksM